MTPDGISFFEGSGFEETFDKWAPGRVLVTPDRPTFTPTPEGSPSNGRDRSRSPGRGSVYDEDLLIGF